MAVSRRSLIWAPLAALVSPRLALGAEIHPIPEIAAALERIYNFDFDAAHQKLDAFIAAHPEHPLGYSFRASAYLFGELDRLRILESEFLTDDDKIQADENLAASPRIREAFIEAIQASDRLALAEPDKDVSALFALCMNEGMTTDYMAFIEKRRIASLSHAKRSQNFAVDLMHRYPAFVDAKLTSGVSEYLLGSLPFFLRWFVRMPEVQGDKSKAIDNLNAVARDGRYLAPFARILLAIVHLREKRPAQSRALLEGLVRDYPENALLRQELTKLSRRK